MEDYYINLYTKEFTKSFSRAQKWYRSGIRVEVVRIKNGKRLISWEM